MNIYIKQRFNNYNPLIDFYNTENNYIKLNIVNANYSQHLVNEFFMNSFVLYT